MNSKHKIKNRIGVTNFLLVILILLVFLGFYGKSLLQIYDNHLVPLIYKEVTYTVGKDIFRCQYEQMLPVSREYEKCMAEGKKSGKAYACISNAKRTGIVQRENPILVTEERFLGMMLRKYEYTSSFEKGPGVFDCKFIETVRNKGV